MPSRPFNLGRKRVGSWLTESRALNKRLLLQPVAGEPEREREKEGEGGEREKERWWNKSKRTGVG